MEIILLGPGCPNCITLEKNTIAALEELNITANVQKEQDIVKIMSYGIMRTPGIVIDGKVVLSGRLPSMSELKELLLAHSNK